jgi:hypothetical protein
LTSVAEPSWKGLYRAGGISTLLVGILTILVILFFLISGPPPSNAAVYLQSVAANKTPTLVLLGLFYAFDILLVPTILAIYHALEGIDRPRMLISAALLLVATTIDLAAGFYTPLLSLSDGYASSTTEAQRAAFVATGQSVIATAQTTGFLVIFLSSIATVIIGSVMLKGDFAKRVAYLGMIAGIVGIVWSLGAPFSGVFGLLVIINFALLAVWFIAVGSKLYRLGR